MPDLLTSRLGVVKRTASLNRAHAVQTHSPPIRLNFLNEVAVLSGFVIKTNELLRKRDIDVSG